MGFVSAMGLLRWTDPRTMYAVLLAVILVLTPLNQWDPKPTPAPVVRWLLTVFVNWGFAWVAAVVAVLAPVRTDPRLWAGFAANGAAAFLLHWWCFGPPLTDRINAATGGYCDGDLAVKGTYECYALGHTWIDGFDTSSHCYLLAQFIVLTGCLLVRAHLPRAGDEESQANSTQVKPRGVDAGRVLGWVLLGRFGVEFLITALFYHTLAERVVGYALGVAIVQVVVLNMR